MDGAKIDLDLTMESTQTDLARYFARRWFESTDELALRDAQAVLDAFLGQNAGHYILVTLKLMRSRPEVAKFLSSEQGDLMDDDVDLGKAIQGFVITGNLWHDALIAYAGHQWLRLRQFEQLPIDDKVFTAYHDVFRALISANSYDAAYLAALWWPLPGLMDEIAYRPLRRRFQDGQFNEQDYIRALKEMSRFTCRLPNYAFEPNCNFGPSYFDDHREAYRLGLDYFRHFGLTHRLAGIFDLNSLTEQDCDDLIRCLRTLESKPENVDAVLMLDFSIYQHRRAHGLGWLRPLADQVDEFLLKHATDEQYTLRDFFHGRLDKIDSGLLGRYINELIAIENTASFAEISLSRFNLYIKNGIKLNDIHFFGAYVLNQVLRAYRNNPSDVQTWLSAQKDPRADFVDTYVKVQSTDNAKLALDFLRNKYKIKSVEDIFNVLGDVSYYKFSVLTGLTSEYFKERHANFIRYKFNDDLDDILGFNYDFRANNLNKFDHLKLPFGIYNLIRRKARDFSYLKLPIGSVLRNQLTDIQREAFEGLNAYFTPERSANFILSKIENGNVPNSEALRTYVGRLLDLVLDEGNELRADTRVRLLNTVSGYYRDFPDLAQFSELKEYLIKDNNMSY